MGQGTVNSLDEAVQLWSLSDVSLIANTASSRVYRVRQADGMPAALKLLRPYGADEIVGVRAMTWWAGDGAATVLATEGLMILMEWLDGAPLADIVRADRTRDPEATEILCDVLNALHRPRGAAPVDLDPLRRRFGPLLDGKPDDWPEAHRPNAGRAVALAVELLATTAEAIPLHGDLHHDNVVGSARGWLAIDPKGVLGDRHYDVSNVFRNPDGAGDLAQHPDRIDALADTFAARLGLDRRRTLQWAAAHCALSECWNRDAGDEGGFNLTMLPLLLEAVDRSR
jgi:streptomycin 6-kinase